MGIKAVSANEKKKKKELDANAARHVTEAFATRTKKELPLQNERGF